MELRIKTVPAKFQITDYSELSGTMQYDCRKIINFQEGNRLDSQLHCTHIGQLKIENNEMLQSCKLVGAKTRSFHDNMHSMRRILKSRQLETEVRTMRLLCIR